MYLKPEGHSNIKQYPKVFLCSWFRASQIYITNVQRDTIGSLYL